MNKYGALKNQMDGMIRDIEELQAENEKLKAQNEKLKRHRVFIPKPIDFSGDGLLFAPEGLKQLYNDEEVEKIVKERDELKVQLRDRVDYIHEQDEVIKDYKHRAEVAERALKRLSHYFARDRDHYFLKNEREKEQFEKEIFEDLINQAKEELEEEK